MTNEPTDTPIELDHRSTLGLEVILVWHPRSRVVAVHVFDLTAGVAHRALVPAADALEAFRHPFAYLPALPGEEALPVREASLC
jgi:hypothetical protein